MHSGEAKLKGVRSIVIRQHAYITPEKAIPRDGCEHSSEADLKGVWCTMLPKGTPDFIVGIKRR